MAYNAWFQCINGCPGEFDLREVIYRCPTCGDLLEVQHDMEALKSRLATAIEKRSGAVFVWEDAPASLAPHPYPGPGNSAPATRGLSIQRIRAGGGIRELWSEPA